MSHECIRVEERFDGQVIQIYLGPAPGNIVDSKVMEELSSEFDLIHKSVKSGEGCHRKLIVITGEGKHFSYGASVEEHRADSVGDMLPKFHALIGQILSSELPTLARVQGLCLGGGFEVALACSLFYCDQSTKAGVPEIQLGVFPPPACVLLPFKTTNSAACHMVLSGKNFMADELYRFGIANEICEKGTLDDRIDGFIKKTILPLSASSIRIAHRAVQMQLVKNYNSVIDEMESLYLKDLMQTKDGVEGIEAFVERRKAVWTHQ